MHFSKTFLLVRRYCLEAIDDFTYYDDLPDTVILLVHQFFNYYFIYVFGANRHGEFGGEVSSLASIKKLTRLQRIGPIQSPKNISVGFQRYIIQCPDNVILASGYNQYSSLGIGKTFNDTNNQSVSNFTRIQFNESSIPHTNQSLSNINKYQNAIQLISNGIVARHTILMTYDHQFFGFGNGSFAAFGDSLSCAHEYSTASFLNDLTQDFHDIFDTSPKSTKSTKSINSSMSFNSLPSYMNYKLQLKEICCGYQYSMFLSTNGYLYGCGNNRFGQLGLPITTYGAYVKYVQIISSLTNIKKSSYIPIKSVAVGYHHTLCVSYSDTLYVFGRNRDGQLGLCNKKVGDKGGSDDGFVLYSCCKKDACLDSAMIHPLFVNQHVSKISAGMNHSLCIVQYENESKCFLFGSNRFQQISSDLEDERVFVPYVYGGIVDGECGIRHSVLLSDSSDIIVLTDDSNISQLKLDKNEYHWIERIICGWQNMMIITH